MKWLIVTVAALLVGTVLGIILYLASPIVPETFQMLQRGDVLGFIVTILDDARYTLAGLVSGCDGTPIDTTREIIGDMIAACY